MTDPSLKQIIRHFFGYERYDEYTEYQCIKSPANSVNSFEFGPMLICNRQVFWLLIDPELLVMPIKLQNFRAAFPAYNEHQLMPIYMSSVIQPDQVKYLTSLGIYAIALGEENMELLNFDELQAR